MLKIDDTVKIIRLQTPEHFINKLGKIITREGSPIGFIYKIKMKDNNLQYLTNWWYSEDELEKVFNLKDKFKYILGEVKK